METNSPLTDQQIRETVAFHGHHCPGLSIGMRAAEWGLQEFGQADDEEIVVVTETNMCGTDAIQYLIGCTFGKGNLIFRDIGKVAFTFFRRRDGKRGRIVLNPDLAFDRGIKSEANVSEEELILLKQKKIEQIMQANLNELFLFSVPDGEIPEKAKIYKTIRCEICGEGVMESRLQTVDHKKICIDCSQKKR
ncbi:MAG: FmdE family protein [Planctomycetia bacterium]|nr:FmdE family protein [Planctomycetia bacterium]